MSVFALSLPKSAASKADILDAGRPLFSSWLFDATPQWSGSWNWSHLIYIRQYLGQLTRRRINKLMLFLPPRHGKTEMTTIHYSAWRLCNAPSERIIIGAYNQTLANKFSRRVRKLALAQGVPIDPKRTAVEEWETESGGGLRAAGVGSGVTGMGGDLIIIDDPVKNREEANSITYREKVWNWYTDDLYTRLEPDGQMILIMTRWHEDDLAGRILEGEDGQNWTVISLPAFAEAGDSLGRSHGQPLCPERYDDQALNSIKTAIGSRAFAALYQQRPTEQEGGMFKRSWFKFTNESPEIETSVRYWDLATTAGGGDYTAGVKVGRGVDGNYYILDLKHGQWSTNERDEIIKRAAIEDGTDVTQWIEEEPGSSGKDRTGYLVKQMAGMVVRGDRVTGSKETRAEPFSAQCEAGNVYLLRAQWNGRFIDELCMFPNGANDDIVDGSSGGFSKVAAGGVRLLW